MYDKKEIKNRLINFTASFVSVLLLGMVIVKFADINVTTDERQLKMLLSGEITSSNFIALISSPMALLIRCLYKLFPRLEIYYVVIYGAILFAFALIVYAICDRLKQCSLKIRIIGFVFAYTLSLFCLLEFLLQIRYTYAAIILAVSAFAYILVKENLSIFDTVLVAVVCAFSAGFRFVGFLMVLPFVLLAVLYRLVKSKGDKKPQKSLIALMCIVIVVAFCSNAVNVYMYSQGDEKDLLTVDKLRSGLQDYQILPSYRECAEAYDEIGVTPVQVSLIRHALWGIADITDVTTLQRLTQIRDDYYENESISDKINRMKETFLEVFGQVSTVYNFSCVFLSVTALIILIRQRDKLKLCLLLCTLLGCMGEVLYLCCKGRMPFRVFFPTEIIAILVSSVIIAGYLLARPNRKKVKSLFLATFAVIFVIGIFGTVNRAERRIVSYEPYSLATESFEKESAMLYLHLGSMAYSKANFLRDEVKTASYVNAGGNLSEMNAWKNLVCGEYDSVAKAIASRDDLRLVTKRENKDVGTIVEYLNQEGYEVSCEFEEVEFGGECFKIWKINNGK